MCIIFLGHFLGKQSCKAINDVSLADGCQCTVKDDLVLIAKAKSKEVKQKKIEFHEVIYYIQLLRYPSISSNQQLPK